MHCGKNVIGVHQPIIQPIIPEKYLFLEDHGLDNWLLYTTTINSLILEIIQNCFIKSICDQSWVQHTNFSLHTNFLAPSDCNVSSMTMSSLKPIRNLTVNLENNFQVLQLARYQDFNIKTLCTAITRQESCGAHTITATSKQNCVVT